MVDPPNEGIRSVVEPELLGEQREREQAPREVRIVCELEHRVPHMLEVPRPERELVEARREPALPLVAPEIGRERLHGPVVHAEIALGIAPCREQEERAPARLVQLGVGELDVLSREVGDDRERVFQLSALQCCKEVCDRVHARIIACARRTTSRPSSMPPTTSEIT
jgi:hypothetical protein